MSSLMLHPSSHMTHNDINGAVFILDQMWICLACLLRPGSWSFPMCEDSIVLQSGSLSVISVDIITGAIVLVASFVRYIFAPESAIDSMLLLGLLGGVLI